MKAKKNNFRYSLSAKIVTLVTLIIIFFGTAAVFFVYFISFNTIKNNEKEHSLASGELYAKIIFQRFAEAETVAKEITKRSEIVDHFMVEHDHAAHINDSPITLYLEHYNVGDQFDAIYMMDKNGLTVASTEPSFLGQDYSFRNYYKRIMAGDPFYVDSYVGVTSNKLGYYFSAPVLNENNEVVAVVVCKLRADTIHANVSEVGDTDKYQAISMFLDKNGVILYSEDVSRIYKSVAKLPEDLLNNFKESKRFNKIDIEHLSFNEIRNIIEGDFFGSKLIDYKDEITGDRLIVSISSVGYYPFYLVFEVNTNSFSKESADLAIILAMAVLAAALSAILIVNFAIKLILKPLSKFTKVTNSIALGDFNVKLPIESSDEIGAFAKSINKMSASIKDYSENIEKKVNEKTERIEKVNRVLVGRELKMIELKKKIKKYEEKK